MSAAANTNGARDPMSGDLDGWTLCDEDAVPWTDEPISAPRARGRAEDAAPKPPPRLAELLPGSLERVERRCRGVEKPIALPWAVLADHFGGGLWPGLHVVTKGTGVGGTQFALQAAIHAAKHKVPALYIGLELAELDLAVRMLGEEAQVPWSHLWTGTAGPKYLERVNEALPRLQDLPFHYEVARPHGFAPSALRAAVGGMRSAYPETDGPGSRPLLVIVDFLQLVGDETGDEQDLRVRVGRASYVLRELASRGVAVLCISSVARERYKLLNEIHTVGELTWETDPSGYPVKRRILNTDAIVGAGKESGDIEYSADSVSVLARVPQTWDGTGVDVVFATAKGRATGATWSPLRFTGFAYRECEDRGGRMIDAWNEASEKRERAREERKAAKEDAKAAAIAADAEAIRAYVAAHPGCSVREARVHAVKDTARRWSAAVALLGPDLVQTSVRTETGKRVALTLAPEGRG